MNNIAPHASRRRLRFRLRTLLLVIGVCAIWLAWIVARAQKQREVAEWARSFGRQPKYSYQFDSNGKYLPNASPNVPQWFVDKLGIDYFSRLEWVHLDDRPVENIERLSKLDCLRHLELCDARISDIGPVRHHSDLEHLSISQNPIDDLTPVSHLVKLKRLYANKTHIADLEPLRNLMHLENVVLSRTRIVDLSPLSNHPKLRQLDVSETNVWDISPLKSAKSLVALNLSGTKVSEDDIEALKTALPACTITR